MWMLLSLLMTAGLECSSDADCAVVVPCPCSCCRAQPEAMSVGEARTITDRCATLGPCAPAGGCEEVCPAVDPLDTFVARCRKHQCVRELAAKKRSEQGATMEDEFATAVQATGSSYLNAEVALLNGGEAARRTFLAHREDPDFLARTLASLLEGWQRTRPTVHAAVSDYLDAVGPGLEKTAVGRPPPLGVANELTQRFGAKAVGLLAVRLIKSPDWPDWRTLGVVLYLDHHHQPTATAPLLRFVAETKDPHARELAMKALRATADPQFAEKVASEERHQATLGRKVSLGVELLDR